MNKEIFQNGAKLFVKVLVVNIMCFFLVLSLQVLFTAAFTEVAGYTVYEVHSDSSETKELYTHYYSNGEDSRLKEYEDAGYTLNKATIRTEMSKTQKAITLTVSQIFCILILIAFIYPNIWDLGTKDSNLVKFKHKTEYKKKGLDIGLLAVIPFYLVLILFCIMKAGLFPDFPVTLHRFLCASFYGLIDPILGGAQIMKDLSWWRLSLLFLLPLSVPVISGIAYYLGYQNFSIGEKLIYKKNKE